jgi:hypothetical protein
VNVIDFATDESAGRTAILDRNGRYYAGIMRIDLDTCIVESVRIIVAADVSPRIEHDTAGEPVIDRCPFRLVSDERRSNGWRIITVEWLHEIPACAMPLPRRTRQAMETA